MKEITMKPVSSSQISSIGYDSDSQELFIEFTSGKVYRFFKVPEIVFKTFVASKSPGSFLHSQIIDIYEYDRITTFVSVENKLHTN
jgi:hypothetical protein